MGAVEELFGRGSQSTLTGTLGGTLGAEEPPPQPDFDIDLQQAAAGAPTGLSGLPAFAERPPAITTFEDSPFGFALDRRREAGQGLGSLAGQVAAVAARPIKALLDLIGNLDRPQQFLFGAITHGLETGSISEGLEAGFNAAVFRRPEPGGPKRRIEASEVINSVGKHMFGKENLTETLHPAARFSLELGVLFGLDPLIFTPAAWYAKAGNGIKMLHRGLIHSDKARMSVSAGTSIENIGHVVTNSKIERELQTLGRLEGPVDQGIVRVGSDVSDDELMLIRDWVTGKEAKGVVSDELRKLYAAGELDPSQTARFLEGLTERVDENDIDLFAEQVHRLVAAYRNSSDNTLQYVMKTRVGNKKQTQVATLEMLADSKEFGRDILAGQLINKFGLDPVVALRPEVLSAARRGIGKQSRRRVEQLRQAGITVRGGRASFSTLDAWQGLSQNARQRLMGAKKGRNKRNVATGTYSDDADLIAKAGLDPGEVQSIRDAFETQVLTRIGRQDPITTPGEFLGDIFRATGRKRIPARSSRAFRDATQRSITEGPFVVDAIVAKRLGDRFRRVGLTMKAGREVAEIAAGIRRPETISDLPDAASVYEAVSSVVQADKRITKDVSILGFMFEPRQIVGEGIYSLLKHSEDTMRSVGNAINKHLDGIFVHRGRALGRGSEESKAIALALNWDPTTQTGKYMGDAWRKALGRTSQEAYDFVKNDDELFGLYQAARVYFDGWAEAFTRRGLKGFKAGTPIEGYFPILYPDLKNSLKEAVRMGILGSDEAADILKRSKDKFGHVTPMELDLIDGNSVFFRHMRERVLDEPLPGASIDLIDGINAYTQASLRKMYLEPAIQGANQLGRGLPNVRKKYLKLLLKRMRGVEILDEEALNIFASQVRDKFGFTPKLRPATRAALAITRNFYRGLLGWNIGFFLKNLSQGINTATVNGPLNSWQGLAMMVTNPVVDPRTGTRFRQLVSSRNMLNDFKQVMEKSEGFGFKWIQKMDDILFSPAHASEYLNRGIAFGAGLTKRMKELGFTSTRELFEGSPEKWKDAVRFAHATANETQFVYGIVSRSPLAGSPLGRLGLQFFSWPVKQLQFFKQGVNDEGYRFMMRFAMYSGMFSKIAEHAEVDAGSFAGFGFIPNQASPSYQAMGHLFAAIEAGAVEGDTETSRRHFAKLAEQMQNMIPAFNQLYKTARAVESAQTGVQRGFRGRFARRTDDPNNEQPLSAVNRALGINLSGEQLAQFAGLPTVPRNKFRELTRKLAQESRKASITAAKHMDEYIRAYEQGDFIGADQVRVKAFEQDGILLTGEAIKRELAQKTTGAIDREIAGIRKDQRDRILQEAFDEDPETMRHFSGATPLPPTILHQTRP
jgi:hypothetical protein